ncbi:MAG: 2Fe-2S iron-sulfur cluster-binding protein, partial [Quisquiliibacterium sp.]
MSATTVSFELDGRLVQGRTDEPILQAAHRAGIQVPHLCYQPGLEPEGNCRACMVEIDGERVLAPSCCRAPTAGMKVRTDSERARQARRMVLELLQADMPKQALSRNDQLLHWATVEQVPVPRFAPRARATPDVSHPAIAVRLDACIQCTRCLRACRDAQGNDVIGMALRGDQARIVFDQGDPLGASSCVGCGECVQACPTGALMPAAEVALPEPERQVDTICPYCGVGCQLRLNLRDNRITHVEGRNGPANAQRLCVKGRFGFDYVHHPQRLTRPLIRRDDAPAPGEPAIDPQRLPELFREASWDEALDLVGKRLTVIRDRHG